MPTVVHVSPHPDDESLGAPCTLLALRAAGWHVVNVAVGFGRPGDATRRRRELEDAVAVAGFELAVLPSPPGISADDDHDEAYRTLRDDLPTHLDRADLVVGPHPYDAHHGHVTVARAVRDVVAGTGTPWWMWSIWADLRRPTLLVECTTEHRATSAAMLACHAGELARNDYPALHDPRRRVDAVRGTERVLGFGAAQTLTHAELLTEVRTHDGRWQEGRHRVLDPHDVTTTWRDLADPQDVVASTGPRGASRAR